MLIQNVGEGRNRKGSRAKSAPRKRCTQIWNWCCGVIKIFQRIYVTQKRLKMLKMIFHFSLQILVIPGQVESVVQAKDWQWKDLNLNSRHGNILLCKFKPVLILLSFTFSSGARTRQGLYQCYNFSFPECKAFTICTINFPIDHIMPCGTSLSFKYLQCIYASSISTKAPWIEKGTKFSNRPYC